jgi:7,8-dihydroneopterin aldolase/epimerase/oxygenase
VDTIHIRELVVQAVVGVHAWERRIEQRLVFDLALGRPIAAAAASDDVADTVDYVAVCRDVTSIVQEARARLIETLAVRVADHLLAHFGLEHVRVRVSKPGAVPAAASVAVEVERTVARP